MTPLAKNVVRRSTIKWQGHEIVITLRADQQIEMHLLGCRKSVKAPILELYRYLERTDTDIKIPQRSK